MPPEIISEKKDLFAEIKLLVKDLFNLRNDTDFEGTINSIKSNIDFRSANAWTLVFAIFIASIGLNINSTAVIIGAMLISPLMGPIVGAGFALGTQDLVLLKRCLKNLLAAVLISILTSTLYFLLSPISEAQSELLARTRPSFFDVMIAFFGGAVGIVALSRKEKSNAIPGVAIATALMPPLCTAGFGLATGKIAYFLGAFYLFTINGLFIAIATFLVVKYLHFPIQSVSNIPKANVNKVLYYIVSLAVVPSLVSAWFLQREAAFSSRVNLFVKSEIKRAGYFVIDQEIVNEWKSPKLILTLIGDKDSDDNIKQIIQKSNVYSIDPSKIEVKYSSLTQNLEQSYKKQMSESDQQITLLQQHLSDSNSKLNQILVVKKLEQDINKEITIAFPQIKSVNFNLKPIQTNESNNLEPKLEDLKIYQVNVSWLNRPTTTVINRVNEFIKTRANVSTECCQHQLELKN